MADFKPTPEQQAIIEHDPGRHARVLAGPGTGKSATTVALVERLLSGDARPRLRLLTFTRAATGELAQKVADYPKAATLRPSTVHSFAISLLLHNPGAGNFPKPLRIADDWEQDKLIYPDIARLVGVRKDYVQWKLVPEMASAWEHLEPVFKDEVDAETRARFVEAWQRHRQLYGYTLLSELPYALRQGLNDHPDFSGLDSEVLIVDEYQDLNACDLEVLRLAAGRGCTIIGVGDDDQSIYSFRNAAPVGIRRFLEDYPGAVHYPISVTQRCGSEIIRWANYVIAGDLERDPEKQALEPAPGSRPGEVGLLSFHDQEAEAEGVARLVVGLQNEGVSPADMLVLLRSDHQGKFSAPIRDCLMAAGVLCFDPNEVNEMLATEQNRFLLAALRIACRRDDPLAWRTLVTRTPGLGEKFVEYVQDRAEAGGDQFGHALLTAHDGGFDGLLPGRAEKASALVRGVLDWVERHPVPEETEDGWGAWVTEHSGDGMVPGPTNELAGLLGRLDERAEVGEDLPRYVSGIGPLGRDLMQNECEGLRIMRMRGSKGLTVRANIIVGAEDALIPGIGENLPEERRLMYVAMTRARTHLYCTWARRRTGVTARAGAARVGKFRQPTRFFEGGPVKSVDGNGFIMRRFGR